MRFLCLKRAPEVSESDTRGGADVSQTSIDAGKLNQAVEILTIAESPADVWLWQSTRPARAQVTL